MHAINEFLLCFLVGAMFLMSLENKKKIDVIMEKLVSVQHCQEKQEVLTDKICDKLQTFKEKMRLWNNKLKFVRHWVDDLEQQLAEHTKQEDIQEKAACDPPSLCNETASLSPPASMVSSQW